MSKIKKVLLMSAAYVLVAALAIGGTIAYLTSSDSDANVMTLGNVSIEQIEQQRVDDKNNQTVLKDFKNDKPLFPAVFEGSSINWAPPDEWVVAGEQAWKVVADNANVVDKFVTVKNNGKSDAFVRTLIAYEGNAQYGPNGAYIHIVTNGSNVNPEIANNFIGYINIDGVDYTVFEYVYPEAVAANETTIPSLKQVYMNKDADNDVVAYYGETYDIIVLSQAVQTAGFTDAKAALDTAFGKLGTNEGLDLCGDWFEGALVPEIDVWDGTADTSWYNETDTKFTISSAEEFAGLAKLVDDGKTFEGKTITLSKNIDLDNKLFDPIGSYRNDTSFKGIFDGNGKTVSKLSQNTWELDNGYYYTDCGLGLFGAVEEGTVKNLTLDGVSISGESALCGAVAAVAHNTTFENITVKNANIADYQYYAGGIAGWASGEINVIGCNIYASTNVAAQWGDFDNSIGGILGGASGSAEIIMKDTTVACRIDAYNDVTSSYQWYAYRRAGMLIGNSGNVESIDGKSVAVCPQLTCKNVTVVYDDWANYTYCEFAGKNWPYVRVQAGVSNSAYSNPRYGHPTDANDNEVVDDNHTHNDGEDHQMLLVFDQLYGGGQGVYGTASHDGVTVIYNNK